MVPSSSLFRPAAYNRKSPLRNIQLLRQTFQTGEDTGSNKYGGAAADSHGGGSMCDLYQEEATESLHLS